MGGAMPGSPAWAGIDLKKKKAGHFWLGFPRVGGDRPWAGIATAVLTTVPPRGRG